MKSKNSKKRVKDESKFNKFLESQEKMLILQNEMLKNPTHNSEIQQIIYKIEKFEKLQQELIDKFHNMNDSIYNPDNGLYARVKTLENELFDELEKLKLDIKHYNIWKDEKEKSLKKNEHLIIEQEKMILTQKFFIDDLLAFKQKISSIIKWASVTFGGAVISLLFKIIYDFYVKMF
jgi:hypothetical protein